MIRGTEQPATPSRTTGGLGKLLELAAPMMISLVGAGGKTSAMLSLADELSRAGHAVILTTSTKIYRPDLPLILDDDPFSLMAEAELRVKPGQVLALGRELIPTEPRPKLKGLSCQLLDELFYRDMAAYVLVEADGSRRLPLKAPRMGEPLVPQKTGLVLGLIGLSVLNRPADENSVFNLPGFLEITGHEPGEPISLYSLEHLIRHPKGLFKNTPQGAKKALLLNQFDLLSQDQQAEVLQMMAGLKDVWALAGSVALGQYYPPAKVSR
jgi:probable selenium-dependent hydroxylase accessory protein YqeC